MKRWGVTIGGLILCGLLGVAAGLGTFTFHYAEGASYFSSDPRSCVNCHVMREQYDGWQKASHHHVATCNDCHTPHDFINKYRVKAENGFWHSYAFTLQNYPDPIRIKPRNAVVLNEACISCHKEMVADVVGHGDRTLSCVHCHSEVGHGPRR